MRGGSSQRRKRGGDSCGKVGGKSDRGILIKKEGGIEGEPIFRKKGKERDREDAYTAKKRE